MLKARRLAGGTALALTAVFGAVVSPAVGQTLPVADAKLAATASLDSKIPVDPKMAVGTLPNGLRYYIRSNGRPVQRAELRLVVNAGSLVEDEDQRGLAHFVEHMAFNGTKHFAEQEITRFMESIGMRFGPGMNASTSADQTVYALHVPTDDMQVLEKAFLILEDWAHNVTFDPKEIEKERGVVIEEWRQARGAEARIGDEQVPVIFKGSRYAERLPIGRREVIEKFPHEALVRFYKDWYRPDLMAVIAVGDFDRDTVERLIRDRFGRIPEAANKRPKPSSEIPDHAETLYAISTDKEIPTASVTVLYKHPLHDQTTHRGYRDIMVSRLFALALNRRLAEMTLKPEAPFVAAAAGPRELLGRAKEACTLAAVVKENEIERGLEALVTESERVARHGFTESELQREKADLLRLYERAFAERGTEESAPLADEYVRAFTTDEPTPGIAYEYALCQRFIPEVSLAEVNARAADWSGERNRVVLVVAPQKEGLRVPDAKGLARVLASATTKAIAAFTDTVAGRSLLENLPEPGNVIEVSRKPFGIVEWKLSNGATVVVRPTTIKDDEIVFRATSPGGTSLASDEDFVSADSAVAIIPAGGLGSFTAPELDKVLAGKLAAVRPVIGETEEGLAGGGSPQDLETLLQLVYLNFTAPRADPTVFGVLTSQMRSLLANQSATPEFLFRQALEEALSSGHPRARLMTPELVDKLDLQKAFAFYKDRFADASDFTFFFAGTIDTERLRPLVERYIATLPSLGRVERWRDTGIDPPKGIVERTIRKGVEPKARVAIAFAGPFQYDLQNRARLRALAVVLETRLREQLREELGGTYGASVNTSQQKYPDEEYRLTIDFGCSPDRTDELVRVVFKQIAELKASGPTDREVNDAREGLLRRHETMMAENDSLLAAIVNAYENGEGLEELTNGGAHYRGLSSSAIQQAARAWLPEDNHVKIVLLPEK
ncbi:MAG: M16 family metallopeptidase [Vicinamibacterales bacterium]